MNKTRDPHTAIHQCRQSIKILRATLRLLRFELAEDLFKGENQFYRDESGKLSAARDLTAMLETIDKMSEAGLKKAMVSKLSTLKTSINKERSGYSKDIAQQIADTRVALAAHPFITKQITWSEDYVNNLLQGLTKVYRRGYKCFQICQDNPSSEDFHQWRKRAKYLRYQLMILRNLWPAMMVSWEKELNHLTNFLGEANNIAVLQHYLLSKRSGLNKKERDLILMLTQDNHKTYIAKANSLGQKLYSERPKAFTRRMGTYLSNWENVQ